ncbi:hypothetical protein ACFQ67_02030 [Streptomyces sp. NPDC056488]|uniref:hypothetical protein n=1 Tax=unclassified Streptomyces TaxID=2593676 RepID=UPI0036A98640
MPDSLRALWLRGIAFNPAAPAEALIRLLDPVAGKAGPLMCEGRDLPGTVVDAALRHPAGDIRGALARNRFIDPARLAPLARDPSGLVRARLAGGPDPNCGFRLRYVRPLPDDILVTLLTAQDGGDDGRLTAEEIRSELESSRQMPLSFRRSLADREHSGLRMRAAQSWDSLTPEQREGLLDDPDPAVREAAEKADWMLDPRQVEAQLPDCDARGKLFVFATCALPDAVVDQCLADDIALPLARNPHIPAHAVARLARHPEAEVRALIAARPDLEPHLIAELKQDPDDGVRMRIRLRPYPRTWNEYSWFNWTVDHGPDCTCPIIEPDTDSSPEWFAACAASGEPVLRQVAARSPRLPAELVDKLAQDDDEAVRVDLACHHPLAPPRLLLDVFVTRPVHRPHLLTLPGFPRTGTAHLINHPDPQVRALAAADPTLTDPPLNDPDPSIRRAAAANPSLTPETLETLLTTSHTAEGAAANPSLPASRIHALLDHCLTTTD